MSEQKKRLTNNFICSIVDDLDDWLIEKGIRVPNVERDEENPDNETNFYGEDFDWFMEMIREHCMENGIVVEDRWD